MFPNLDVEIRDTPFDPDASERNVEVKQRDGTDLYRVFIYLVGRDLPFVRKVTYYLHESIPEPVRTLTRSDTNRDFRLEVWLWGKFDMRAIVEDVKGNAHELSHSLAYDRYFDEARFGEEKLRLQRR